MTKKRRQETSEEREGGQERQLTKGKEGREVDSEGRKLVLRRGRMRE